jgi:hypothetical protein
MQRNKAVWFRRCWRAPGSAVQSGKAPAPVLLTRVDKDTVERVLDGRDGTRLATRYTISPDGRELFKTWTDWGSNDASIGDRVEDSSGHADALVGVWRFNPQKSLTRGSRAVTTFSLAGDGRLCYQSGAAKYTAAFDGKEYPTAMPGRNVVLKRIDGRTFEATTKDNTTYTSSRITVSPGGEEMTIVMTGTFASQPSRRVIVLRRDAVKR